MDFNIGSFNLANQGPELDTIIELRYSYCSIVHLWFYCDNTN